MIIVTGGEIWNGNGCLFRLDGFAMTAFRREGYRPVLEREERNEQRKFRKQTGFNSQKSPRREGEAAGGAQEQGDGAVRVEGGGALA
jgi:hypothetical protein